MSKLSYWGRGIVIITVPDWLLTWQGNSPPPPPTRLPPPDAAHWSTSTWLFAPGMGLPLIGLGFRPLTTGPPIMLPAVPMVTGEGPLMAFWCTEPGGEGKRTDWRDMAPGETGGRAWPPPAELVIVMAILGRVKTAVVCVCKATIQGDTFISSMMTTCYKE